MKTRTSGIERKTRLILAMWAALAGVGLSAQAQSLGIYFNLQSYGTVNAGNTILDGLGNTSATLNAPQTSLTSSGLTVASASGNSASTGLALSSSALNAYTGSFSIQDWVTVANPNNGVVLWGANNGAANTYIGDGYTGVTTLIGFTWGSLTGGGGAGNPLNEAYNRYGTTITSLSLTPGQTYDMVLTYDASTYTYNQYINGALVGTLQWALGIDSLAGAQYLTVGGCPNEPWSPWGDASADSTTEDFLVYNGELNASQVTALDAAGAGASVGTIASIVPEPPSSALMAFAGASGLVFWRRSVRSSLTAKP